MEPSHRRRCDAQKDPHTQHRQKEMHGIMKLHLWNDRDNLWKVAGWFNKQPSPQGFDLDLMKGPHGVGMLFCILFLCFDIEDVTPILLKTNKTLQGQPSLLAKFLKHLGICLLFFTVRGHSKHEYWSLQQ
jgi:hypothetical protein